MLNKKKHRGINIALIAFFLFLIAAFLISSLGTFLVRQDKLEKADAMVILMGNVPDRATEAYDIYKEAYAREIIVVTPQNNSSKRSRKKKTPLERQTALKKALMDMDFLSENITILPGDAKNTYEEAVAVRKYLYNNPGLDTLILVTSNYHSRRASITFEKELSLLNRPTVLISRPSKYSYFNSKGWWKDNKSFKIVFYENLKLLYIWLFR